MIGISTKEEKEYIVEKDRNSKDPTIFVLKPITASEFININSVLIAEKAEEKTKAAIDKVQAIKTIVPTVLAGVKKIKNIWSEKEKKAVDIETPTLSDIDSLPFDILTELYNEIMSLNKVSESEEKN
jgi:hypothetical protein